MALSVLLSLVDLQNLVCPVVDDDVKRGTIIIDTASSSFRHIYLLSFIFLINS